MGEWTLEKGIRYVLGQHGQGMKLEDLEEGLAVLKEDGKIDDCCVANVLDVIENADDLDYLIYGNNSYFVFKR